jgi:hypothetical protein
VTHRDSKVSLHSFHYTTRFQPTFLLFSFSSPSFSFLVALLPLVHYKPSTESNKIRVSL